MNDLVKKIDGTQNVHSAHESQLKFFTGRSSGISWLEKSFYIALFVLLVGIRIPAILNGRMWAEEGTVFFVNAWNNPWYKALWTSYGGYLNISANVAGILAKNIAPLEKACYVTSIFGLIVQTFPVVLLCLSRDPWLQNRKVLAAALLLVATLPLSQEIWLSSIGSQCHLNLCVALILVLAPQTGASGIFQKFLLVVAPLSGPGSALLLPLFAMRAWLDRSKARMVQMLILGLASIVQFVFFWHPEERLAVGVAKGAVLGIDPGLLLDVFFVKHILAPFFGAAQAAEYARGWGDAYAHAQLVSPQSMCISAFLLAIFAFAVWRCRQAEPRWLYVSGAVLFVVANFGALGTRAALLNIGDCERYVFAPQILFELAILYFAFICTGWRKSLATGIICWLLVIGCHEYFWTAPFYREGPVWRQEVHVWRGDHSHQLQIWPKGWTVTLKKNEEQK